MEIIHFLQSIRNISLVKMSHDLALLGAASAPCSRIKPADRGEPDHSADRHPGLERAATLCELAGCHG